MSAVTSGCHGTENMPKGHEIASASSPDGASKAFVWFPELSGLGATVSQPYQVWVQYLRGSKDRRLVFEADRTDGVRLTWKDIGTLEICYAPPSHIYRFLNFFEYAEEKSPGLYQVEILLRKVPKLGDC
jgi:hypothetical protein